MQGEPASREMVAGLQPSLATTRNASRTMVPSGFAAREGKQVTAGQILVVIDE